MKLITRKEATPSRSRRGRSAAERCKGKNEQARQEGEVNLVQGGGGVEEGRVTIASYSGHIGIESCEIES